MHRPSLSRVFTCLALGFLLGFNSCTGVPVDNAMSAAEGNDPTLVLSGCGSTYPRQAYVFCRSREGANPTEKITLTFPLTSCRTEACAVFQVIKKDGSYGLGGGIAKGTNTVDLSISDITGSERPLTVSDDGEYQILIKIFYTGTDGAEHVTISKGFVRINILAAGYEPVACADPAIAWEVKLATKGCAVWTTKMRGAVCEKC